jgi:hypothetical protein
MKALKERELELKARELAIREINAKKRREVEERQFKLRVLEIQLREADAVDRKAENRTKREDLRKKWR